MCKANATIYIRMYKLTCKADKSHEYKVHRYLGVEWDLSSEWYALYMIEYTTIHLLKDLMHYLKTSVKRNSMQENVRR